MRTEPIKLHQHNRVQANFPLAVVAKTLIRPEFCFIGAEIKRPVTDNEDRSSHPSFERDDRGSLKETNLSAPRGVFREQRGLEANRKKRNNNRGDNGNGSRRCCSSTRSGNLIFRLPFVPLFHPPSRRMERSREARSEGKRMFFSRIVAVHNCESSFLKISWHSGRGREECSFFFFEEKLAGVLVATGGWYWFSGTIRQQRGGAIAAPVVAPPYLFPPGRPGRDCGKWIFQGLLPVADSSSIHVSTTSWRLNVRAPSFSMRPTRFQWSGNDLSTRDVHTAANRVRRSVRGPTFRTGSCKQRASDDWQVVVSG